MTACPDSAMGWTGPPHIGTTYSDGFVVVQVTHVDWKLDGSAIYGFDLKQLVGPPITSVIVHGGGRSFQFHRLHDLDTFVGDDGTHLPMARWEVCYTAELPTTTTVPETTTTSTTVAETTTTVAPTTTVPETTTTVAPTTTVTVVETTLPPETTVEATTTTAMVELPRTGSEAQQLAGVGGSLVLVGVFVAAIAKRAIR